MVFKLQVAELIFDILFDTDCNHFLTNIPEELAEIICIERWLMYLNDPNGVTSQVKCIACLRNMDMASLYPIIIELEEVSTNVNWLTDGF